MAKSNFLKLFKFLIGWPLSFLAFFFIGKIIFSNYQKIPFSFADLNILVLGYATLCFIAYFFLRSILWQKILAYKGHHFSLREVAFSWEASEIKRFIPGNIWSILARGILFSEKNIDKKTIFSSFFIEAQLLVIACLILSLFSLSFFLSFITTNTRLHEIIVISFSVAVGIITLLYLYGTKLTPIFPDKFRKLAYTFFPHFSIAQNTSLVIIAFFAYFFFALGTYFSIAAFYFLSPAFFLTFIGIFITSLIIGYISFITPMGLGIREAISIAGISRFIPLSQAAIGAIIARLILIFSEIIFFTLTFLWNKSKNKTLARYEEWVGKNIHLVLLGIFIGFYTLYFTHASFLRHENFYSGRFDLGNMDQTVWNTSKGDFFQFTNPDGTNIISRLSFHADYILTLFAPFYTVYPSPKILLFSQSIILALGAIFIYLLSLHVVKNKTISLILAVLYLFNPGIQFTNLYDFHAVTIATTTLLGAFYFLVKEKYNWFLIFAILSAFTKEQVWITISLFGFYIVFKHALNKKETREKIKRVFLGIVVAIISASVFYYLVSFAIPAARQGGNHFALEYYSEFGTSPKNIILNVLFNPVKIINILLRSESINYITKLFGPLGYAAFFSPLHLIFIAPDLLLVLLSNNNQLRQIYYQYTATLTPFIFIAGIYGLNNIKKKLKKGYVFFVVYMAASTMYAAYFYGPLPFSKKPNIDMFIKQEPKRKFIEEELSHIPPEYKIAATNNLGAHLSYRNYIFTIPLGIEEADVVAFLLNDPFAQPSLKIQKEMVNQLKRNNEYTIRAEKDDFILFEKIKN